ncbi:putative helicase MOV-10 isoform X2 [Vanessa cardui]|uniref:putative helicase MOV-10 isoform X2 n=1 Tax=Vanessa cardui TaxID=171605 RepID=UPI001F13C297|nr:putative helicase MOV-10 isoform X2 [Vanessa cardui]
MICKVCGIVDEHYDENALVDHEDTPKHLCNLILLNYKHKKKLYSKNRDGVIILCSAECITENTTTVTVENSDHHKIIVYVKPNEKVNFSFSIQNDMRNEDLLVIGVQLAHPQPQFKMSNHPFIFGKDPHILEKKSSIKEDVSVNFKAVDIGQYEMPIVFTFHRRSDEKNLIFIREMVILVQEEFLLPWSNKSPYTSSNWEKAEHFFESTMHVPYQVNYKIPKLLKILLPRGLDERALEGLKETPENIMKLKKLLISTRAIFDEGPTKNNYMLYFHHLLWWEEIICRINLRKYNMAGVEIEQRGDVFVLEVPGLAEKRPSLLRGDRVFIRPVSSPNVIFESVIKDIDDCHIHLSDIDPSFASCAGAGAAFDVRFLMSRVPAERAHAAVSALFASRQAGRAFPAPAPRTPPCRALARFYNPLIAGNTEQKSAVEHIVSGTSGLAPYIVFGPPGTGKTMTIVEAIIQLVVQSTKNRIMVCTDSNMAADHIALMLMQYNKKLNIGNFLLRASSQSREWSVMPPGLAPVSNGTSYESFYSVSNVHVSSYRIFVTTLLHAAKYGSVRSQTAYKLQMTHMFIDEAAQASEPATLVPVTGLLAPSGQLVLAGDPQQLGPVCISKEAAARGLGQSLLARLKQTYENLYTDPNYITMLVKNFRSHPDILRIPNELFYDNCLEPLAALDPLSNKNILGSEGGESAVVFHAVHSREQRMGKAPSYFNEKELEMLKRYIKALIEKHQVSPKDIGVIAPYIRQVYKMKGWLTSENYKDIEVGTVESFQGKEKRVILVSTVRANCRLLDYDAKYGLGFLVDDKRYNVTLTRAKAKLIIIGNPTCLTRDIKWRKYMDFCRQKNCYYGQETQQIERSSALLTEIARSRFDKCRLSDFLVPKTEKVTKKNKK